MRLLSWNYQRLGNPWIGRSLLKFVKDQVPDVCFHMETRLDEDGFNDLYRDLPFKNKLFVKRPNAGGGLALLWKQDIHYEARVRFGTRVRVRDSAIFKKVGCGCGGTQIGRASCRERVFNWV